MADNPYLHWPVFKRSVVAAFQRSLTFVRECRALKLTYGESAFGPYVRAEAPVITT
jgi:hypothetical protein